MRRSMWSGIPPEAAQSTRSSSSIGSLIVSSLTTPTKTDPAGSFHDGAEIVAILTIGQLSETVSMQAMISQWLTVKPERRRPRGELPLPEDLGWSVHIAGRRSLARSRGVCRARTGRGAVEENSHEPNQDFRHSCDGRITGRQAIVHSRGRALDAHGRQRPLPSLSRAAASSLHQRRGGARRRLPEDDLPLDRSGDSPTNHPSQRCDPHLPGKSAPRSPQDEKIADRVIKSPGLK